MNFQLHNVKIRTFTDQDLEKINNLHKTVFRGSRPVEQAIWKFLTRKLSAPIVIAEDDHKNIIGMYCSILSEVKYKNKKILIAQGVDNAILPQHQKQGIQRAMYERWKEEARKLNLPLLIGFTNSSALDQGVKGLNYGLCSYLPVLATNIEKASLFLKIKNKLSRVLNRIYNFKTKDKIKISYVKKFDSRIDLLFEKLSKHHEIIHMRNADFLNWRILEAPIKSSIALQAERNDELLGYIAIKIRNENGQKVGYIFDIFCEEDELVLNLLLNASYNYFKEFNANQVKIFITSNNFYYNTIKKLGFENVDWKPFGFVVIPLDDSLDKEFLMDINNWFITLIDTDL